MTALDILLATSAPELPDEKQCNHYPGQRRCDWCDLGKPPAYEPCTECGELWTAVDGLTLCWACQADLGGEAGT